MRILAVTQPNSGVGYHRMMLPLRHLPGVSVLFTDFINDEVLERGFDIVTFNRFIVGVELSDLIAYRKKYGFKIVMDLDDYWILDSWHILAKNFPSQVIIDHIKAADLVTVTHARLMIEVGKIARLPEILPNALPFDEGQFHAGRVAVDTMNDNMEQPVADGAVRFLYAGGITHRKDIELMAYPMRALADDDKYRERIHLIMAGYDDSNPQTIPTWNGMVHDYTAAHRMNFHLRAPLPPDQYMAFYAEADVAFAPLVESKFNTMKSNIKALEAGCKYIPLIASNVHPYQSCPPILKVDARRDWGKHIRAMVDSKRRREDAGMALGEWVRREHHLTNWNKKRKQLYEWIITK